MTPNTVATGARSSFRLVNDWKAVRGRRGSPGVARWGRIRRDSGASKRNFPSPSNGGYRRKWRLLRYARLNVRAEMKSYNGFRGWIYIRQRVDLFNRGLKIPQCSRVSMIGFYGVDQEGVVEENAEWKAVESCVRLYHTKLILELITRKFLALSSYICFV